MINVLYKVPKVIQILKFVKVNQLILGPFRKSEICFLMEGLIAVVKESGDLVEIDEELAGSVIVFHDQLFEFNFSIGTWSYGLKLIKSSSTNSS